MKRTLDICQGCPEFDPYEDHCDDECLLESIMRHGANEVPDDCLRMLEYIVLTQGKEDAARPENLRKTQYPNDNSYTRN